MSLPVLPKTQRTFLEVLKVHNREVMIANLLAYFFKPQEDHGLGDLFITSLLQTNCFKLASHSPDQIPEEIVKFKTVYIEHAEVKIEDVTGDQKRLDLLIKTTDFVIGIEFKINHALNNPLNTYIQHVEKNYPKPYYFVVLTPQWKAPEGEAREENTETFRQVILSHFMAKVKENLKVRFPDFENRTDKQYHTFCDLLITIENRQKNKKIRDLIKVNFEHLKGNSVIDPNGDWRRAMSKIEEEIIRKLKRLKRGLKLAGLLNDNQLYRGKDLSIKDGVSLNRYIVINQQDFSIKARLTVEGWTIEKWHENAKIQMIPANKFLDFNVSTVEILDKIKDLANQVKIVKAEGE